MQPYGNGAVVVLWEVIAWIVVIGSLGAIFAKAVESVNPDVEPWEVFVKIVLFVPMIIFAGIIHVVSNFRGNKLGYTMLLLVIGIILFTLFKGFQYGPSSVGNIE